MMTMPTPPATIGEFQDRLVDVSDGLPKRLKQCADFVALNTDRIAISTVAELSASAGVQPSAFVRFCQLLGFSGYSQMQRLFRDNQSRGWPDYSTRLENLRANGDGTPAALLAEFVDAGRSSLESLANSIDEETLEAAVETLSQASTIHVVGLNRAFPVAAYLAYTFDKMSIPAFLHDRVGNLDHRHVIQAEDALIAISFASYTPETLDLVTYADTKGCRIVAITDAMNSPLHRIGATTLMVSEVDVGAFRALSATLSLAASLSVAVGARRRDR